jgi:hypothetical protein
MNLSTAKPWKQVIVAVAATAEFAPPALETALVAAEHTLQVQLPPELRELLLECDGVTADYGSGVVWAVSEIQRRNLEFRENQSFRELYMPFEHLLFFGDDGGGDQFAFSIKADGKIHSPDIYRWEHETDSRSWFSSGFRQFFKNRLNR